VVQVKSTNEVLAESHRDSQLVTRVGQRIVSALPKPGSAELQGYFGHLARYQWQFAVVKSKEVNAFVAPGGKVVVYTGTPSDTRMRAYSGPGPACWSAPAPPCACAARTCRRCLPQVCLRTLGALAQACST
jgi:hypothetical protein